MKSLLLTLGHNSSAILIENGQVRWGYETERMTGVKSDSTFPAEVLLNKGLKPSDIDQAFVTHWSPDGQLKSMGRKYWKPEYLDGVPIRTLSVTTSHHDTHMLAAMAYAGKAWCRDKTTIGVVVDGFGTYGEHFSVYAVGASEPVLLRRYHGYDTSLGLWYQYATAFMGMKMHEDEYKLLGYEVHVPSYFVERLDQHAAQFGDDWLCRMETSIYGSSYDPLYNVDALPAVRDRIYSHLTKVCNDFGVTDPTTFEGRAIIAYFVQAVLEHVVQGVLAGYSYDNLLCSGGCFYNVKLNNVLLSNLSGDRQICVYPLAGDQGNALGLYHLDHELQFPEDMNWGVRELKAPGVVPGMRFVEDEYKAWDVIYSIIKRTGYVNVVRGNMEFGPRAMCNTSTLALPTSHNVSIINAANNRNTVMPMAPVMTEKQYNNLFYFTRNVHKSHRHMIMAMEYRNHEQVHEMTGAAHPYKYPTAHFTGRPQVTIESHDPNLHALLAQTGPLINTSFNFHGYPIAYDVESVIKNHMAQYQRDPSFQTVVITNA